MKIAIVFSRPWMRFSPDLATAQELTVRDLMINFPSSVSSRLFAPKVQNSYTDVDVSLFSQEGLINKRFFLSRMVKDIIRYDPDIIVVQSHLPTADYIGRKIKNIPVILHRHNDYDPPHENILKRTFQIRRFRFLDGIIFVSRHNQQDFLKNWEKLVTCPTWVVPNGMDLSIWNPVEPLKRKDEILFVGRAIPEKGGLELARALVKILPQYPYFGARFIFGAPNINPEYRKTIDTMMKPFSSQVTIEYQRPWAEIRTAFESAAIAVVPSLWAEPFGRTALEAMAGGAALIASTRGGLDEVVGNGAYRLDEGVCSDTIQKALVALIGNQKLRADLSDRALEQAKKYTLHAQVSSFLEICAKIIKKK